MFKSTKPSGQPRTLRSIVESQNDSSNFPAPFAAPEQPQAKPQACPEPTPRRDTAANKTPFRNIKNG